MKKQVMTNEIRTAAIEAMWNELCVPRLEALRGKVGLTVFTFIDSVTPKIVKESFAKSPEYFNSACEVVLYTWNEKGHWFHESASFPSIPVTDSIRYRLHNTFECETLSELYGHLPLYKAAIDSINCFNVERQRCIELREASKRVLMGIRFADDIKHDYPEFMKWITIPEKKTQLIVRADALKTIVEQMTA